MDLLCVIQPLLRRVMDGTKRGLVAVIFTSRRNGQDPQAYDEASNAMAREAARQPGYRGMESVRDADGDGITISYWADEAAARAWRDHAGHAAIREAGRAIWYDRYEIVVAEVTRGYRWERG